MVTHKNTRVVVYESGAVCREWKYRQLTASNLFPNSYWAIISNKIKLLMAICQVKSYKWFYLISTDINYLNTNVDISVFKVITPILKSVIIYVWVINPRSWSHMEHMAEASLSMETYSTKARPWVGFESTAWSVAAQRSNHCAVRSPA